MMWLVTVAIVWIAVALALGMVIGRAIRRADRDEAAKGMAADVQHWLSARRRPPLADAGSEPPAPRPQPGHGVPGQGAHPTARKTG